MELCLTARALWDQLMGTLNGIPCGRIDGILIKWKYSRREKPIPRIRERGVSVYIVVVAAVGVLHVTCTVRTQSGENLSVRPSLPIIRSFIPLACAECVDSLPFLAASSIRLCYIPFPSTVFHLLVFHPPSLLLAIYFWSTSQPYCFQIHLHNTFFGNSNSFHSLYMPNPT